MKKIFQITKHINQSKLVSNIQASTLNIKSANNNIKIFDPIIYNRKKSYNDMI